MTVDKKKPGQISAFVFENKFDVGVITNSIGMQNLMLHPFLSSPGKWIFDEVLPLIKQRKMEKLKNQGGFIGEIYM